MIPSLVSHPFQYLFDPFTVLFIYSFTIRLTCFSITIPYHIQKLQLEPNLEHKQKAPNNTSLEVLTYHICIQTHSLAWISSSPHDHSIGFIPSNTKFFLDGNESGFVSRSHYPLPYMVTRIEGSCAVVTKMVMYGDGRMNLILIKCEHVETVTYLDACPGTMASSTHSHMGIDAQELFQSIKVHVYRYITEIADWMSQIS